MQIADVVSVLRSIATRSFAQRVAHDGHGSDVALMTPCASRVARRASAPRALSAPTRLQPDLRPLLGSRPFRHVMA